MSGTDRCYLSFNSKKWYNITFMIYPTDEETKAQKALFILWANQPCLLDTGYILGPVSCSGEIVVHAWETDILWSN